MLRHLRTERSQRFRSSNQVSAPLRDGRVTSHPADVQQRKEFDPDEHPRPLKLLHVEENAGQVVSVPR
jgi:hypothetical protein